MEKFEISRVFEELGFSLSDQSKEHIFKAKDWIKNKKSKN